jgi:hypothetical protein
MAQTKLDLSDNKFEQLSNEILHLSGCTHVFGQFKLESGSTLSISSNHGTGKVLTSNSGGTATWQNIDVGIADACNGLSTNGISVCLGGYLCQDTVIDCAYCLSFGSITRPLKDFRVYSSACTSVCNICDSTITIGSIYGTCCSMSNITPNGLLLYNTKLFGGSGDAKICMCSATLGLWSCSGICSNTLCITPTAMTITGTYSSFKGIQYANDYNTNFGSRSLVDKGYVDNKVLAGDITGATNGLTKSGKNIILGGTLTGNTCISDYTYVNSLGIDAKDIYFDASNGTGRFAEADINGLTGIFLRAYNTGNTANSCINICNVTGKILLDAYNNGTGYNHCISIARCGEIRIIEGTNQNTITLGTSGSGINIDAAIYCANITANQFINLNALSGVTLQTTPKNGTCTDSVLVWNPSTCLINKVPYISGETGGGGDVTGATNGLTKSGKNIILGGTLTGETFICTQGNKGYLRLDNTDFTVAMSGTCGNASISVDGGVSDTILINTSIGTGIGIYGNTFDTVGISTCGGAGVCVDGMNNCIDITSANVKLPTAPADGSCSDSVLVIDGSGIIKKVPYISGSTCASLSEFTITGNSSATGFTVNHAKNKQFVAVEIVKGSSPYDTVYTSVSRPNANCVCITFDTAPANGQQYKILITS